MNIVGRCLRRELVTEIVIEVWKLVISSAGDVVVVQWIHRSEFHNDGHSVCMSYPAAMDAIAIANALPDRFLPFTYAAAPMCK